MTATRPTAAYRHALGPAPVCRPDDRAAARFYLARIQAVIDQRGWSEQERRALYRMRNLWARRAAGQDARFLVAGNRRGCLPPDLRLQVAILQRNAT